MPIRPFMPAALSMWGMCRELIHHEGAAVAVDAEFLLALLETYSSRPNYHKVMSDKMKDAASPAKYLQVSHHHVLALW